MKESVIEEKTGKRLQQMTMTALMTAVICILAPLSIPIGPVPISFTALAIYLSLYLLGWKLGTVSCLIYILLGAVGLPVFSGIPIGPVPISFTALAIYLSLYLLGWKLGTVSCLIYILLGAVGLPVFSGFSGGIGKLLGPTGGYIIGFLPMAVLAGAVMERYHNRFIQFSAMTAGMALCYVFGTIWFCIVMKTTVAAALRHRNENYRGSSSERVCNSVYSGRYDQNYDCSDRGTNIEKKITAGRNIGKIKGIAVIRDKANSREI